MNCYIPPIMALKLAKALKRVLSEPMSQDDYEAINILAQLFKNLGKSTLAEERLEGVELAEHIAEVKHYTA